MWHVFYYTNGVARKIEVNLQSAMTIEDHIWALATKKLSNGASEPELLELDNLLQEYPEINRDIRQLFNWWYNDEDQNRVNKGEILFAKILEKIKQTEKQQSVKQVNKN